MKYIIFIRLLCQESITRTELNDSQQLIEDFVVEFEKLYGVDSMLSNLHGHLHLAHQVYLYGPLNKTSAYIFENQFKMARSGFHGTVNIEGQIAKSLYQHKDVLVDLISLKSVTLNDQIKFYIEDNLLRNQSQSQD